jgi:deoxyribonuclease V
MNSWNVTPKEAVEIQKQLREQVRIEPFKKAGAIRYIAGADVSMNLYSNTVYAGFVVLAYPSLEIVAHAVVQDETKFPYIPGLLSFREIPSLLKAWEKLMKEHPDTRPDVIVVDGIGIAHPRRFGIASHLGVLLDMPTIGCAKSVLIGTYDEPAPEPGSFSYLRDKFHDNEIIGAALRTKILGKVGGVRRTVKPVFISPGNKINLEDSLAIITSCIRAHRLPEPTRLAHETVNQYRIRGTDSVITKAERVDKLPL